MRHTAPNPGRALEAMEFEQLASLASDAILVVEGDHVVFANDAAERLFTSLGRRDALSGTPVEDLWERGTRAGDDPAIVRVPPGDGMPHATVLRLAATPRVGDRYAVRLARAKEAPDAAALRNRFDQLTAAIDQASYAILVIDAETLNYVHVNQAAARMADLPHDLLMERGAGWYTESTGQQSAAKLKADYRKMIDAYPAVNSGEYRYDPPGRAPMVLEYVRRAVRSEDRWLILSVIRDVTEHRAAQARLEALGAAVDAATDAIMVIDPVQFEYVVVNEAYARLFGATRELMMSSGAVRTVDRVGLATVEELRARHDELIRNHPEHQTELQRLEFDGRPPVVLETVRKALQLDGRWLILVHSRDVTEREKARADLEQRAADLARSNRELEEFAYVASHDLSEPLRMVASYTQLLARRYGDKFDDDGREFLGFIVDGAQRMKQLIDDLLLYSRAGRADAKMQVQPLDGALDLALANLEHALRESGAAIERPGPLPELPIEKTGIAQLFQNLVGNALKFRGDRPAVVRIGAQRDGDTWVISVADNGIGIPPESFERIFVIFQRLHSRTQYEGTGIGLAICKKIVERHGGRIWVEPNPGGGTCFKFTLPAATPAAAARL